MEYCSSVYQPIARDRLAPMPNAPNDLMAPSPGMAATGAQQQVSKLTEEEKLKSDRVFVLLEAILEEQTGLRGVIRQLEEGLCTKLDGLDKSVASCNSSGPFGFPNMDVENGLTEEEEAKEFADEARKWFANMDKDKSGSLSKDELKSLLTSWSMNAKPSLKGQLNITCQEDVDRLIEAADKDRSGCISVDEFLDLVNIRKQETAEFGKDFGVAQNGIIFDSESSVGANSCVEKLVASAFFEAFSMGVILANMVIMCISLQMGGLDTGSKIGMRQFEDSWAAHEVRFGLVDKLFNGLYLVELILRMWVYIHQRRFSVADGMDTLLVVICCLDSFVLQPMNVAFVNVAVLRLARLVKLSRFFKALRYSEALSALRVLVCTLLAAVHGVVWSVVLVGSIIAAGGILMTQFTAPFLQDEATDPKTKEWIYKHFGTLTSSIYTMFESIFSGSWVNVARPLIEDVHYGFSLFWIAWIVLVKFVTMRVVGAMFMQETFRIATLDKEKCAMNQLKRKGALSESLRKIFKAADTSGDGGISQEEFDGMMSRKFVVKEFATLGLDVDEVAQFFSVLVADDGTADYNEFLDGALAMATSSPTVDMMKQLQHQVKMEEGVQKLIQLLMPVHKFFDTTGKAAAKKH